MTEAEWLACVEPAQMLAFVREKARDRKLRLYLCALSYLIRTLVTDHRSWNAVEVAERYVDGLATSQDLAAAHKASCQAAQALNDCVRQEYATAPARVQERMRRGISEDPVIDGVWQRTDAVRAAWQIAHTACDEINDHWTATRGRIPESIVQCCVLHDIFGNPFRPVTFSPEWRTSTAVALARQMYESRDFSAMPILADAIQDAGCEDEQLLGHCRGSAPHVRGCWVVDLVLGKE